MHCSECDFLSDRHRLYGWLRTAWDEGEQAMTETILLGAVTVALLVYLVYALLRPEKF
jgi:K+-transporting ATPase KdpF subunit